MHFVLVGKSGKSDKQIKIQRAKKIWEKKPTFTFLVLPPLIFGGSERKFAGMPKNLRKIFDKEDVDKGVSGLTWKTKEKNYFYRKWLYEEKEEEYQQAKEFIHQIHQNLNTKRLHPISSLTHGFKSVGNNSSQSKEFKREASLLKEFKHEHLEEEKEGEEEKGKEEKEGGEGKEGKKKKGVRKIKPLGSPTYHHDSH